MGVLLYADDEVFTLEKPENKLFGLLTGEKPVLGVSSIEQAENALKSIGSFDAIILDWDFGEDAVLDVSDELEGVKISKPSTKEDETFTFLENNHLYCLVYIFSENDIESSKYGDRLKGLFGNRIKFLKKENFTTNAEVQGTKEQILHEIQEWKSNNTGLSFPIKWGQSINQSIQAVFAELAMADESWVKEIYDTVNTDGLDGKVFMVELLQMILSEQILTDDSLLTKIEEVANSIKSTADEESTSKLFSRLYYSKLSEGSPIMTGDICRVNENTFAVIITPECDIKDVLNGKVMHFDALIFDNSSFDILIKSRYPDYTREQYNAWKEGNDKAKKKVKNLKILFNQNEPKVHFLPSFPLFTEDLKSTGLINFSHNTIRLTTEEVIHSREYKLNSPFVQQLRQRYLSYIGRVGVPALPSALKNWNLG